MNLVTSASKFGSYIFRQKFCVASSHKNIHIFFAKITIQNSFKAIQHLNFIQQKIIHSFIYNFRTNISYKFFRVNSTFFLFNLNQAFPNQIKIIS